MLEKVRVQIYLKCSTVWDFLEYKKCIYFARYDLDQIRVDLSMFRYVLRLGVVMKKKSNFVVMN